jgi:tRNA pseudouridine38-40 synthase
VAPDPLFRRHVHTYPRALEVGALAAASRSLEGLRDFRAFCRPRAGATTIRDLREFSWRREEGGADAGLVVATVRADAFCHSMVRSLVGAVLAVGDGRRDAAWLAAVASSPRRSSAITIAAAQGLTLEEVVFPSDAQIARRAAAPRSRRTLN